MAGQRSDAEHDLNVLVDVARRLGETFELDPLLQSIEQAGRSALECERATVFLFDAGTDELVSQVATGTDEIRFSVKLGIAGEAARTRSIIMVPDAYADERFNRQIDKQTGYRTRNVLTLPLITPTGELMGVLQVLNKLEGGFTEHDERIAAALGSLTGLAIKRQRLLDEAAEKQKLERDLNIAREIQQRLLPDAPPRLEGFEVAGWNKPADQTGGDCYDYYALADDRLGVMIADATGHGIGPALIVSQCRALLRGLADTEHDLATVADKVNRLLCEDLPDDRFVTTCFGVLDVRAARFTYVSAGHGPLLWYRAATGEVVSFSASCPPMGVLPEAEMLVADPIAFEPGDLFFLPTDGFTEWMRAGGEMYGEGRLCDLIRRHHDRPCAELIGIIYQDVLGFAANAPQLDDLTAVAIKRAPMSRKATLGS